MWWTFHLCQSYVHGQRSSADEQASHQIPAAWYVAWYQPQFFHRCSPDIESESTFVMCEELENVISHINIQTHVGPATDYRLHLMLNEWMNDGHFNMQSKADGCQLNLLHRTKKLKEKKRKNWKKKQCWAKKTWSLHQRSPPVRSTVANIQLQLNNNLSTPKGRKAELAWLVDLWWMA